MNLLSLIIDRLNQRVATHNLFDQIYGLSELNQNGNEKAWINYIGDGQAQVVSDYDGANGTIFWAKRGRVTLSKNEQYNAVSCKQLYLTSIPLTAYAIVRKSSLPCDLADSVDFVANQIFKYVSGKDVDFKIATGLIQYDVIPASYGEETKSLSKNYEWACVTVDFNIEITSDSNDGCYAPCDNVPLPPYNPPTGNCCNIAIYDEGQIITESVTQFDFTGEGVTATSVGGAVTITITGGGSGSAEWGSIGTGTGVSSQTDLVNYLLANFYPLLSNPSAFLVAADLLPYLTSIDAALTYYPIPTGLTTDYIRGDGSIAAFPSAGIGTVTDYIFTDGNGFTGTVSTSTSTPTLSLTIQTASASQNGQLSSTDWSTFNGKFNMPTGTNADYLDGTGTPTLFPTIPAGGLPAGGTAGQILTKVDATNYNATWQDNYADWTSVVKHTVKNNGLSGTITKGTAVYVTGSNGTNMLVGRASNDSEPTSSKTMGLMQSDITTTGANSTGFVITEGLIDGLNTAGQTAGDPVWLGVNGALIYGLINKPYAPNHLVFIGIVTKISAGNGEIFVKVQNGFELKELHDVQAQSPTLKDTLWYDNTVSPAQWKTASISTILGYNPLTPYQKQSFQNRAQNNSLGMLYCASNNVVYCSNSLTGFVYCYNATTGALLASINVTSATAVMYLPVKGEIYVTTFNTGTITRISTAATPTLLGTITGSGTWGIDLVEYSATKVFIVNSASNTTTVINPTTNVVAATITTTNLVSSITLNSNGASLHNGMLILSGSGGIGMINPATNTLVAAANNLGSLLNTGAKIIYNSTLNLYLYCDIVLNQLTYISPLAATTFTVSFYTTNLNKVSNIIHDPTNSVYIVSTLNLTTTANTYPASVILNFINTTTRLSLRQVITTSSVLSAVYQVGYLTAGTSSNIFVSGGGSLLTNEIIYA